MNTDTFWNLIARTKSDSSGDSSKQAELLVEALTQLPESDILTYDVILGNLIDEAYDADLWDAAYIVGCGCSDDGFDDFRAWLIGQGKDVFQTVLADPESLADIVAVGEETKAGELLGVAREAYERRTGKEKPRAPHTPPVLKGKTRIEAEKKVRFPRLAAKFGNCQDWFLK